MDKTDWIFSALRFLLENTDTDDEAAKLELLNISDRIIIEEDIKKDTRSNEIPPMSSRVFYKSDFSARKPTIVRDSDDGKWGDL